MTRRPVTSLVLLVSSAAFALACGSSTGESGSPSVGDVVATPAGAQETGGAASTAVPPMGRAWVILGTDTVIAEVARTAEERSVGLMNRTEVPDGSGMLFVYEDSAIRSFWMRDTYVALDIAYIDSELRIIDIKAMEPETTESHPSAAPAMFALEVRQGWFAEHGIAVGAVVEIVYGG